MANRKAKRSRRDVHQQIADLEAQLEALRGRAAAREEFDPAEVHADRERLGLSAKDYGALVGVSPLTIYGWESGRTQPQAAQLQKWLGIKGMAPAKAYKRLGIEDTTKDRQKFSPKVVYAERERLELSARDYAELVGVSMLTVYNWEKGKSAPRDEQLKLWMKVKGIKKADAWKQLGY
jgi:DNA-binding transcriptional regulator YiaG